MAILARPLVLSLLALTSTLATAEPSPHIAQEPQKPLFSKPIANPKRVAVIGAGSAGASAAYYLSKYASAEHLSQPPSITIYEREVHQGGRAVTLNVHGNNSQAVELGASIFVEVNHNLVNAAKEFNLPTTSFDRTTREDGKQVLGVWNGDEFVMTQTLVGASKLEDLWQKAKLLLRYGFAPLKVIDLMKETVARFLRMYEAPIFPFKDLTEAVYAVGLQNTTGVTGLQLLESKGLAGLFANEVVQASTRVNYAQNLAYIHGLEAMVCMATDGAMSIEGGNWRIFAGMIKASGANLLIKSPVTKIRRLANGSYTITHRHPKMGREVEEPSYDAVVLASPYHLSDLVFESEDKNKDIHVPDKIPYVKLHVTVLATHHKINPRAFNLADDELAPDIILTTLQPDEKPSGEPSKIAGRANFFSLSTLRTVINRYHDPPRQEYLYKIFSPSRVYLEDLRAIVGVDPPLPQPFTAKSPPALDPSDREIVDDPYNKISWLYRHVWDSYPYEEPRVTFERLNLDGDMLYYTSGIESFISTMETSSLMGKNVARLIADKFIEEERLARGSGKSEKQDLEEEGDQGRVSEGL